MFGVSWWWVLKKKNRKEICFFIQDSFYSFKILFQSKNYLSFQFTIKSINISSKFWLVSGIPESNASRRQRRVSATTYSTEKTRCTYVNSALVFHLQSSHLQFSTPLPPPTVHLLTGLQTLCILLPLRTIKGWSHRLLSSLLFFEQS